MAEQTLRANVSAIQSSREQPIVQAGVLFGSANLLAGSRAARTARGPFRARFPPGSECLGRAARAPFLRRPTFLAGRCGSTRCSQAEDQRGGVEDSYVPFSAICTNATINYHVPS